MADGVARAAHLSAWPRAGPSPVRCGQAESGPRWPAVLGQLGTSQARGETAQRTTLIQAVGCGTNLHREARWTMCHPRLCLPLVPKCPMRPAHWEDHVWCHPPNPAPPQCGPPHPVDLVKSPQMSAVAAVAGLGCGQDIVAPPVDVPILNG